MKRWMVGLMVLAMGMVCATAAYAWEERIKIKGTDGKTREYEVRERFGYSGDTSYVTIRDQRTGQEMEGVRRYGIVRNTLNLRNARTGETLDIDFGPDPDYFSYGPDD